MNRLVISIIILAVISVGCICSVFVVNDITQKMEETIDNVESAFEDENFEESVRFAEELQKQWDDFVGFSILINDLGHAVEIQGSIAEIKSFAQSEDDEIYTACDRAQAQLKLFREVQHPTFWKIL